MGPEAPSVTGAMARVSATRAAAAGATNWNRIGSGPNLIWFIANHLVSGVSGFEPREAICFGLVHLDGDKRKPAPLRRPDDSEPTGGRALLSHPRFAVDQFYCARLQVSVSEPCESFSSKIRPSSPI